MVKNIVLCADDYGQAEHISQAIIQLIQQSRLSATSCLVNQKDWPAQAARLKPFRDKIDIGIHFNLTEGTALSEAYANQYGHQFSSLKIVLAKSMLRLLNPSAIEAECHAQIDRFFEAMGFLPQFLDGHQHVHQFPQVREAILSAHQKRLSHAYLRVPRENLTWREGLFHPKRLILRNTGAQSLKHRVETLKIAHNTSFSGVYPFSKAHHYGEFFPRFLKAIENGGLILCHPGLPTDLLKDPLAHVRIEEFQYLSSQAFLKDCSKNNVIVSRFGGKSLLLSE